MLFFAFICTYVSVVSILSIEFTATELENPFGEDHNDLPFYDFQDEINSSLLVLLDPAACLPPNLNDTAILNYDELAKAPYAMFDPGLDDANWSVDPQAIEKGPTKTLDLTPAAPAEPFEQEPPPRMPHQNEPVCKTGSLEARRQEESKAAEFATVTGPAKPSEFPEKVGPRKEATSASARSSVAFSEFTDFGTSPSKSDIAWHESIIVDQRILQQEMLQTLVNILKRLDEPLSVSSVCVV